MDTPKDLLRLDQSREARAYMDLAKLEAVGSDEVITWGDKDTAELGALLAEYASIRQESMNSITHRTQILTFGLAAVAALVGGSLTISDLSSQPALVFGIFSIAVPGACTFVLLLWLSEAVRSHRAGQYLASVVEARVNAKLGKLVLSWEGALWTGILPRDEMWGPSMAALGIFGLIALASPVFGVVLTGRSVGLSGPPLAELWVPYVLLLLVVVYCILHMDRLKNTGSVTSRLHVTAASKNSRTSAKG